MATTTVADVPIYDEEMYDAASERVTYNLALWNSQSSGAIVLSDERAAGDFTKRTFAKTIAGNTRFRSDPTDVSNLTAVKVTFGEEVGPTVKGGSELMEMTADAFASTFNQDFGGDPIEFARFWGDGLADGMQAQELDTSLAACVFALAGKGVTNTHWASAGMTSNDFIDGYYKMGDRTANYGVCVMNSAVHKALVKDQVSDNIFEVAGFALKNATPATMNLPVLVTDSPGLIYEQDSVTKYATLLLQAGAIRVRNVQRERFRFDEDIKTANSKVQFKGEWAFNLRLKGFKWNTAITAPTLAELTAPGNWTAITTSHKDLPGAMIVTTI